MASVYECEACGVITTQPERLCTPRQLADKGIYCSMAPVAGEMCKSMKDHETCVCGSCGRIAGEAELLCNPSVPW